LVKLFASLLKLSVPFMSRTSIILIVVVSAVIVFFIVKKILSGNASEAAAPQRKAGGPVLSEVMVIRDTTLAYELQSTGTIRANEEVSIANELAGKLTGIYFKEGTVVSKGALLFKLDDAELLAQKKKLDVERSLATQNEERMKVLVDKGGTSKQEYDVANSNLQSIQADIDLIEVQLAKTQIRAPFAGKIGLRNVSEGAYVSVNTPLTSLQDVSRVKVDFSLPEKYATMIKAGQEIFFSVENDTQKFFATVLATEPAVDPGTRAIVVRAITGNAAQRLIPGASSKITIVLAENRKTVMVPTSALIPQSAGFNCYVVENGKAALRPLKTGYRDDINVQVLEGLRTGDSLLTTNMLMLRPNAAVKVVNKK
jgi:membrane fusion protein (multidrug efflux system)